MKTLTRLIFFGAFFMAFFASANSPFDIEFPIAELDDCASKEACKEYCDAPEHKDACVLFAKKHGLVSKEDEEKIRNLPSIGPGGCEEINACREYCENPNHTEECILFAKEHGLLEKDDLEKAEKFFGKPGPGGCRGEQCREYCEDPAHNQECVDFAVANGFMTKEEAEHAQKFIGKPGPGGCKGEACKEYCENPDHQNECVDFAVANGFMTKEEAERIKKFAVVNGPGGCRGKECRDYCEDPEHQTECVQFAEEQGFMTKEEAEHAQKFIGKPGPGGCRGEQCREYCEQTENQKACFEFAEREGLLSKTELARARKFMKIADESGPGGCKGESACRTYCENQDNQKECFEFAKAKGFLDPEDERHFEIGKKLEKKLGEAGGPGGCSSPSECRKYCQDSAHAEECMAFAVAHGGISNEDAEKMLEKFINEREGLSDDFSRPKEFDRFKKFEKDIKKRFEDFRDIEMKFRGPGSQNKFFDKRFFNAEREGASNERPIGGPGGCATPMECMQYCNTHRDECEKFIREPEQGNASDPRRQFSPRDDQESIMRSKILKQFNSSDIPDEIRNNPRAMEEFIKKAMEHRNESMKTEFENQQEMQKRAHEFQNENPNERMNVEFQKQIMQQNQGGFQGGFPQDGFQNHDGQFQSQPPQTGGFENVPPPTTQPSSSLHAPDYLASFLYIFR